MNQVLYYNNVNNIYYNYLRYTIITNIVYYKFFTTIELGIIFLI